MITVVGNLKGGTGKSTVTYNLAVWLTLNKKNAVIFDLDPQRTLTDVVERREEEGYGPSITVHHDIDRLNGYKTKPVHALVDVGTADMGAMRTALELADRVLVPVPPSQADIWSTQRFLVLVRKARDGQEMPQVLGFINRADTHHAIRETVEAEGALDELDGIVRMDIRVHQRTPYRRSFTEGLAVFESEPSSKAAKEMLKLAKLLYSKG
jgi:chromosome partitioning protein